MREINEKMEEACGIFGVVANEAPLPLFAHGYFGLYALQHRGQESAGMSLYTASNQMKTIKAMGLVVESFNEAQLQSEKGSALIGHVRYATTGESTIQNAQPISGRLDLGEVSIAHNGNLINLKRIKEVLQNRLVLNTTTDTEWILNTIAYFSNLGETNAIIETAKQLEGSFALLILVNDVLYGVRDPYGIRPLCLGRDKSGNHFLSSETCALDAIDATFVRDILPGEIIRIQGNEITSFRYNDTTKKATCAFEYIYFARPDTIIDGIDVYRVRHQLGRYLYEQMPVEADVVIGVPDSGIQSAIGYAEASGIPYAVGFVKNKYIGRTFISPSQLMRERGVKVKLNPIKSVVNQKRVVVIDDSLVRGTTSKKIVEMLFEAGAKEVHFRSASPIVRNECYFGIDISSKKELIGNQMQVDDICQKIGATTLEFLSMEHLKDVLGSDQFCFGCFTGKYPMLKEEE